MIPRVLCARPGRTAGVIHRRLIGYQRTCRGRSSATRISISVLCDLRGLSLCLSGALPRRAIGGSRTACCVGLCDHPRLALLRPLHRLGVLQGKAGAPPSHHGDPRDPIDLGGPICPMDPEGLAGVVTHDHDHLTNPATSGWRQATRLMVLRCPQELFRWPMGHLLALLGGQDRSSA
jgi:hypothetical protein